MNRFLAFVKKEFYHIYRDKRTLLVLFGMPLVLVLLFGFALTNEIKGAKIAILDFDKGMHSQRLTERLLSSGYFTLRAQLSSYDEIPAQFRRGHTALVVVFPPGFSRDLAHTNKAQVQLLADASEQNTAITLNSYATSIINSYSKSIAVATADPGGVVVSQRMVFNPTMAGSFVFVPGVMALVLLLVSALMTSVTIAREKESGTMEVLLVSPLAQWQILLGKVLPYLTLSLFNGGVIIALGVGLLGVPLLGSLALLLAETMLFVFLALAIGIFISTMAGSQLVAMFSSLIIMLMPSIFLSGFLFPIESMPKVLQAISHIIPARWYIEIVKGIMIKGVGLAVLWPQTLIIAGLAGLFSVASILNLKDRLN